MASAKSIEFLCVWLCGESLLNLMTINVSIDLWKVIEQFIFEMY